MSDEDRFIRAILASPNDPALRLVYADWLEERGSPDAAHRAEYLRLECELDGLSSGNRKRKGLRRRLMKLRESVCKDWWRQLDWASVEHCVTFQYRCPQRWDTLLPTDNAAVRHCQACQRQVYYCRSRQSAQWFADVGECVAIDSRLARLPLRQEMDAAAHEAAEAGRTLGILMPTIPLRPPLGQRGPRIDPATGPTPDPEGRADVGDGAEHFGAPSLVEQLSCEESQDVAAQLVDILRKSNDSQKRLSVISTLGEIGPQVAGVAVPVLIELLQDRDNDTRTLLEVISALGKIGPDATVAAPVLVELLQDRDSDTSTRLEVIAALGKVGNAVDAVPPLIRLLQEGDEAISSRALDALFRIGNCTERVLPILVELLKDERVTTRVMAAKRLGELGAQARVAVPALRRALADESGSVRVYAKCALRSVDSSQAQGTP